MRLVTFKSVHDAVLRRLGLDPDGEAVTYDTARTVAEHINNRIRTAWDAADWPELTTTEERAFRAPWRSGLGYAKDDEVYDVASGSYYRAIAAVAAGTPLNNSAAWQLITEGFSSFIAYQQAGELAIGQVLGIYSADPRVNGSSARPIAFAPGEQGIAVAGGLVAPVWVHFRIRHPLFTAVPIVEGKTYRRGNVVYDPVSGDCYRALTGTADADVANSAHWLLQRFPYLFAQYVKAGAFADALREWPVIERDPVMHQVRQQRASAADQEADAALGREMDRLSEQGQHAHYKIFGGRGRSRHYQPQGASVSSLPVVTT